MISFEKAYGLVLEHCRNFGTEKVPIEEAGGRVLAEAVYADRDFPPSDRATRDGIVISYKAVEKGRVAFEVDGVLAAGDPPSILRNEDLCMEIMTGAVIPYDADTVVMYENLDLIHGIARVNTPPKKGQNIHCRGSDRKKGELVLKENTRIASQDVGILASVGHSEVLVKKLPKIAVVSTGDELVEVNKTPLPHQVRTSNAYQLYAALREEGINPVLLHVADDKDMIRQKLSYAISEMDLLLLSGGVSKGKFDYIPDILEELRVEKIFHKVLQRPGKPFWFGKQKTSATLIFSFPGNPVSTYVCYYRYFRDWLYRSLGLPFMEIDVNLGETVVARGDLTGFIGVKIRREQGKLVASPTKSNGSGDLCSLAETDGFICLSPREAPYHSGSVVPFIPTRKQF
jgi:molybdopterin molybdotransferase